MKVSIVVLTKNAGPCLDSIFLGISAQRIRPKPEIIVVDSGSNDETLSRVCRHGIRLVEIPSREFNHGTTRNLAMSSSSGDMVAFLSQDAIPADECWLDGLLEPFKNEKVAGSFSRHLPRSASSPLVRRLVSQFDLCGSTEPRINELGENISPRRASFFANTSSCIRRSIWEQFSFRKMDFAEDQDWSYRVLQSGFATAYAPRSMVIHSHDYMTRALFMRHFEHALAIRNIYGEKEIAAFSPKNWILEQILADLRYLKDVYPGSRRQKLEWALKSPLWQTVRGFGLWLGSNASSWPSFLVHVLSLQHRIART